MVVRWRCHRLGVAKTGRDMAVAGVRLYKFDVLREYLDTGVDAPGEPQIWSGSRVEHSVQLLPTASATRVALAPLCSLG